MPDRLSTDPASPFYNKALLERGVGVRFKGVERFNVAEYCVSEGWVRLQTQTGARDRRGRPLAVKLQGSVEVWMRAEVQPVARKWKPTTPQLALLEKLYTGGPAPLDPISPQTYAVLDEQGLVQPVTVDGVSMVELSGEGVYWMGGEVPS